MEWQPMQTAPKDGTEIQGWISVTEDGMADKFFWAPRMRFFDDEWQARHPGGWYSMNLLSEVRREPTHWMPLPESPHA